MTLDRRSFLKRAAGAGALAAGLPELPGMLGAPALIHRSPEIVVIGAGAFGG